MQHKAGHTTFRDKASQSMLLPTWRSQQMRENAAEECRGSAPVAGGDHAEEMDPSADLRLSSDDDSEAEEGGNGQCKADETARWVVPKGVLVHNGGDCGPDTAVWLLNHQGPALYRDGPGVTREEIRTALQRTWKDVIADDPSFEEGRSFVAERLDQVPEASEREDLEGQVAAVLHALLRQESDYSAAEDHGQLAAHDHLPYWFVPSDWSQLTKCYQVDFVIHGIPGTENLPCPHCETTGHVHTGLRHTGIDVCLHVHWRGREQSNADGAAWGHWEPMVPAEPHTIEKDLELAEDLANGHHEGDGDEMPRQIDTGSLPAMPQADYPTLEEYQEKWARLLGEHEKPVEGKFSNDNLIPTPNHMLWQDCPYVPFAELKTENSQSRLSVCKPICALQETTRFDGVERFAHNTGGVFFQKRSPMQLSSTLGFVINRCDGQFLGLKEPELAALHEIITWGRQPGNNKILAFFGQTLEEFSNACGSVARQLQTLLPTGGNRVKVRVTARETLNAKETTLEQTLGDERIGMLVMDFEGRPMSYEGVAAYAAIAQHRGVRLDVEELHDGQGWRRCRRSVEIGDDVLDDDCREKLAQGAQALYEDTFVKANDKHYDAKVFPSVHPYGTGSLHAEPGAGKQPTNAFRRNLFALQSWFRHSTAWIFWWCDRMLKQQLFNYNRFSRRGRASAAEAGADNFVRAFGKHVPQVIPESTAWSKEQARDLDAITDVTELGCARHWCACLLFRILSLSLSLSLSFPGATFVSQSLLGSVNILRGWGGRFRLDELHGHRHPHEQCAGDQGRCSRRPFCETDRRG